MKINLNMNCKTFPDAQSYNVIAEITGTEFPDEIIVVGGHFDSWDLGAVHTMMAPVVFNQWKYCTSH